MRKQEALYHINHLINLNEGDDKQALKIAKKSIKKEYKYKFWANVVIFIGILIIFGSFVLMAKFMYYR
ncbi:hypothetical protein [Clostridium oceanicum]|uniref:Uncharacterized protein n=1 Tax=Clostridium oceanicum TaxID=1543 RepID=A0ABN1JC18_9CLOT